MIWCCFILLLTSYPKLAAPKLDLPVSPDKAAHFFMYLIFGILYIRMRKSRMIEKKKVIREIILIMILIPLADEMHQIPIPGRMFSLWDVVADFLGLAASLFFIKRMYKCPVTII